MVKKRATARKATVSKGKSARHARAGKLGGLAPHACRGSECTVLRKKATAAGLKRVKSYSAEELLGFLGISKAKKTKKAAAKKAVKRAAPKRAVRRAARKAVRKTGVKKVVRRAAKKAVARRKRA